MARMEQSHELHRFPAGVESEMGRKGMEFPLEMMPVVAPSAQSAEIIVKRPILLNEKNDVLNTREVVAPQKRSGKQWAQEDKHPERFCFADDNGLP